MRVAEAGQKGGEEGQGSRQALIHLWITDPDDKVASITPMIEHPIHSCANSQKHDQGDTEVPQSSLVHHDHAARVSKEGKEGQEIGDLGGACGDCWTVMRSTLAAFCQSKYRFLRTRCICTRECVSLIRSQAEAEDSDVDYSGIISQHC